MAITTLNGYVGAFKDYLTISKTNSVTTVAGQISTTFDRAGIPAAGTLDVNQITAGVVPTDAVTGYPAIQAFPGGQRGYLSRVEAFWPVTGNLYLYDCLFKAGDIALGTTGATTSLTGQPSYSGRLPFQADGETTDWSQTELWLEATTALSNHAHTVSVAYTDQDGNAGATTGNLSTQNIIVNRLLRFPWAAGDNGVRLVESVTANGVASTTGTFSVMVMRRLWAGRIPIANSLQTFGLDATGMPQIFADSALMLLVQPDSISSSTPSLRLEIAVG